MPRRSAPVLFFASLLVAGCAGLVREGPQLSKVPDDLGYMSSIDSARPVLPGRTKIAQSGYTNNGDPPEFVVFTRYSGTTTRAEAQKAHDETAERYGSSGPYGPLEELEIDGTTSWGWTIEQRDSKSGTLYSRDFVAVVPGDDETWTIEYSSRRDPDWEPSHLREVVSSFSVVHRGSTDIVVYLFLAAAALGLGWGFHRMQQARPRRGADE